MPDPKPDIEFIAPISIKIARTRLATRNEEATFWAGRNEKRLDIKVWKADKDTAGFEMKHLPKSYMTLPLPMFAARLSGILKAHPKNPEQTIVLANYNVPLLNLMFAPLLMMALGLMMGYMVLTIFAENNAPIPGIIAAALTFFVISAYGLFEPEMKKRRFIRILKARLDALDE